MHRKTLVLFEIGLVMIAGLMNCQLVIQSQPPSNSDQTKIFDGIINDQAESELIPSRYESNLAEKYLNNDPIFQTLSTTLENGIDADTIQDSREPAIFATWLGIETLLALNYSFLMASGIRESSVLFLKAHLNGSNMFHEDINYSIYYAKHEDLFLYAPYTPSVIHQTAIIALGKLNALNSEFSPVQLTAWKSAILAAQNSDGGFGTRFKNNSARSTLVETYFAICALLQLNHALGQVLSPTLLSKLQIFLRNHQSAFTIYPNPVFGCFYESSDYTYRGWGWFIADWYACQIIELINAERAMFSEDFKTFVQTWEIYNPDTSCFLHDFNDRDNDNLKSYIGTAVMGECIRIMGIESFFPVTSAQTELLTGMEDRKNFRPFDVSEEHDLCDQFFFAQYMNHSGAIASIPTMKLTNIVNHTASYFNAEGGASFQNNADRSTALDAVLFDMIATFPTATPLAKENQFWTLFNRKSNLGYYFEDRIKKNETLEGTKIFDAYNAPWKNPIATNYYVFATFEKLALMTTFYNVVGWQNYLKYEAWPRSQLLLDGSFVNHSQSLSGNLESTYQALETQRILIAFNTGQTFDTYYSTGDKNLILNFVSQFIHTNATHWWAEHPELSINTATFYVQSILEMLEFIDGIDYTKLTTFIAVQINNSISQDPALMHLVHINQIGLAAKDIYIVPDHISIAQQIQNTILQLAIGNQISHSMLNQMQFLIVASATTNRLMIIDRPAIQTHGTSRTYSVGLCSWISLEPMSNVVLTGEGAKYNQWININLNRIQQMDICPIYSPDHPDIWNWNLEYDTSLGNFQSQGNTETNYNFGAEFHIARGDITNITMIISGSATILDQIIVEFSISNISLEPISIPTSISRELNQISIKATIENLPLDSGTYSVMGIISNAPKSHWNHSNTIQFADNITLIEKTSPPSSSLNNTSLKTTGDEDENQSMNEGFENNFVLNTPAFSIVMVASFGTAVGSTIFVKNTRRMKLLKNKQ